MPMVTRLARVGIYYEELASLNSRDPITARDFLKSSDILNTLYLHLQKTSGHQTRQGADLS